MPGGSATAVVVARSAYRGSAPGDFLFHDAGPVRRSRTRLPFSPAAANTGRPSTAAVVGASAGGTAAAAQVAPAGRGYGSF